MKIVQSEYKKTELENGIRVVTERIPYVRSISIGTWIIVGSRDETLHNNGISHFIEHMMFKGTTNLSAHEIAQSLESVGGHLNAFTGKELTCYFAHVLDEHLPIAVEVIAEILADSIFDEREMEKEKRVVLEELKAIEETPEELVHDLFWDNLFPNHPLGFSIIGNRANILGITKENILDYLKENYTTNRIVIAAAGNVNHEQLVALVKSNFDKFTRANQRTYSVPKNPGNGKKIIENGAIQAHICLGTHSYSYKDRKKFSLLVLNTLLGSGMSSRLFQNIREKHALAYSIYSFIDFLFDTGLIGVYIGTDNQKIEKSIELIIKELEQLVKEPVSEDELKRTKLQLKGNLMLGLESTSGRMNRLAKMEIYLEDYFSLDDTLHEIESVSSEELQVVAEELFERDRISMTILKPKSEG